RSRDSAVHLTVFLFMGIILLRMGPSAGPSTLITNEHMIFIHDFQNFFEKVLGINKQAHSPRFAAEGPGLPPRPA
ncbi:hypothetical protein NE626_15520, partial [Intestinimonas massiliensis]|uniref:hypothetical protein n=1 Tax=Intestinimonas massiliensis (ex Afouda et al. 2020) TaxID=1673721 RepID=UPI00210CDF34